MDRRRIPPSRWSTLTTPLLVGLSGVTAVTAAGVWLLLTDVAVAADVAAAGTLMPLVEAMFESLRSAIAEWLPYL